MSAQILDGRAVAQSTRASILDRAQRLQGQPGLATVLVGDDPASHSYVRSKLKLCSELGFASFHHPFPSGTPQSQVEAVLEALAQDERVHGILVQLPLPSDWDEAAVLGRIPIHKDVDGFHPVHLGHLAMKGRVPEFVACTPAGCMRLLQHYQIPLSGQHAVVVGRSNIVGMPMALLLNQADCTVTLTHSRTRNLEHHLGQADLVVAAVGRPESLRGEHLKPGCCVIDVGINRTPSGLVGDVHFASAREVAGWITPVPGGVGPMTLMMLMENTLKAAEKILPRRELGLGVSGLPS